MRLRTRLQAIAVELQRKEKETEQLARQLQGEKPSSSSAKTNLTESFLVS